MEKKLYDLDAQLEALQAQRQHTAAAAVMEFDEKLDLSWIYHDHALEGVVLSYHELNAAIDKRIISDVSLIPSYEEIKNHKAAIEWARQTARTPQHQPGKKRVGSITLDTLKHMYALLTPDEGAKGSPYRKDTPLHRQYFHEIAAPDKIAARMKKLVEWLDEDETQNLHPVVRAAKAHFKLLAIFPWTKSSGKTARLLMNFMLLRDGYPPAVIHSIDRQRYYDALRVENTAIAQLVAESLSNGMETELQFFQELKEAGHSRRAS